MTKPAFHRLRTTAAAVAFALGLGAVAVVLGDRLDLVDVLGAPSVASSASGSATDVASTALDDAHAVATAATDLAVSTVVSPAGASSLDPAPEGATAGLAVLPASASTIPAPTDDPLAGVIVEAVDPAEALFGDQAAVAVSN